MLFSGFQIALKALNKEKFRVIKNSCAIQANDKLHDSLKDASDSHCLFEALSNNNSYCNWISLNFLEIIANSYKLEQNDYLVNLIKDYKKAFFTKSLREVWSSLPHLSVKGEIDTYYSELKQKLGGRNPDNMSIQELLDIEPQLTKKIAKLLAVIREESLVISWLVPTDEVYQAYLSFLTISQQSRKDDFTHFGNWVAHLPQSVLLEEQKKFGQFN